MFANYQWKITEYGLETNAVEDEYNTEYSIAANDLFEIVTIDGFCFFTATLPLMGRDWVIGDDLIEIYPLALGYHGRLLGKEISAEEVEFAINSFKANDTWQKGRQIRSKFNIPQM